MNILKVENYTKTFNIYHLERQINVFENLSLQMREGEFVLVTGPNGIGKSTLLRCLYRSYRPTGGQALYDSRYGTIDLACAADVDVALLRREEIGFVTQFLRPRPRVSALELVAEPLLTKGVKGVDWDEAKQEAGDWLDAFGLKPDIWHAYPTTFSGGEQQKVNLARALISPRRLLLLDEPTASLDAQTRAALVERLDQLKEQGIAMIGVFHQPEEVMALVDKKVYLEPTNGKARLAEKELAYVVE